MRFEVQHDWQASLATPRPRIGEAAKTRLLLVLCAVWLLLGLVGHHPWKPDESVSASIVKHMLDSGAWMPHVAGAPVPERPPLYYLSAAATAKLFSGWLPLHDGARIATAMWMMITLLMVGMTGREMWGRGEGRQTTFILLGCIGLFFSAHLLNSEVAGLTGAAMAFYGLALAMRRPWRASLLVAGGFMIALLGGGTVTLLIPLVTALLLPMLFRNWRRKSYLTGAATGTLITMPVAAGWLYVLHQHDPVALTTWLLPTLESPSGILYFVETLATWYAWPALPLAGWSLWHFRRHLLQRPQFQLAMTFFVVGLLMLALTADLRDLMAMPLLLPLAVMGGAAIEPLRRGAASALDWFGIMLFGFLGFLVWLGWFAMMTGMPARLAARMQKLSEAYVPHFGWSAFLIALALSVAWMLVVFKANKRSNRAAVTDWAMGITMVWGLLMTLWLPWLDAAKSYHGMFMSMQKALPASYACVTGRNLGSSQRALMDYYLGIQADRFETEQRIACDLYLVQDERKGKIAEPGLEWKLIWQGQRPSDRRERFYLYQYHR